MNQKAGNTDNSFVKYIIIAVVVIIAIAAVVYLGMKRDLELDVKVKRGSKEVEVGLTTGSGESEDKGVKVEQEVETVEGEVVGIKATDTPKEDLPDSIDVTQGIGTVESGGSVTGVDLSK